MMRITGILGLLTRSGHPYPPLAQRFNSNRTLESAMSSVEQDKVIYIMTPEEQKATPPAKEPCLTYAEFRRTQIPSFEAYRQLPIIQELFGSETPIEEMRRAYEEYCTLRYNHYRVEQQGGNPANMI
ncbi:MAG: hypothetical protein ACHQUC_05865 [Chlamydiales bacterium]